MCKGSKRKVGLLLFAMMLLMLVACNKGTDTKDNVATGSDSVVTTEIAEEKATDSDVTTEDKNVDFEIDVDISELEMKVGDVHKVTLSVTPKEDYDIVWSVDTVAVVAVSDGEIKAIAPGECVVAAKIKGTDESVQIKITVNAEEDERADTSKDDKQDDKKSDEENDTSGDTNSGNNTNSGNTNDLNSNNAGNNADAGNNANTENSSNQDNSNTESNSNSTTEATTEAQAEGYYLDYASTVLALVNAERAKVGAPPLSIDYTLMSAANVRAKECSISFSHTRPDGSSCFTAWTVSYGAVGENIAAGYGSAESVVAGWVSSSGHYQNMINPSFTHMAVSCYYDPNSDFGYYWAQCFGGY